MNAGPAITLHCPAKLNLTLAVGDALPPSAGGHAGFHPIESWMVALDFHDTLRVSVPGDGASLMFDLAFADDAPRRQPVDWPLTSDLTYKAHRLVERHTGRTLPVEVVLRKRIPAGAGLGGGSSNAAGMILALDSLYHLRISAEASSSLAHQLGSDVVFALAALRGQTSMLATGLGEKLEPWDLGHMLHVVLLLPDFGCPTGPVYRAFDELSSVPRDPRRMGQLRSACEQAEDVAALSGHLFNDLEAAACVARPPLKALMQSLREQWGRPIHLTGSGSACFLLASDAADAARIARRINADADSGVVAVPTRAIKPG